MAFLLVVSFLFSSCEDEFLDKQPPGTAAGDAMATATGVEGLLIGAYDMLTGDWNHFGTCMATDWVYGDAYSDNAYKGSSAGDQPFFNELERYQTSPISEFMTDRWRDCYNGVARANDALSFLRQAQESAVFSESRAIEIEAEAKFLRAWYHFKATRIWENIPYIKTEEEMGMSPEMVPNDSPAWDDIESDLQFAINNLGTEPPLNQVGRPDQWAAKAVKAHVHLFQNEFNEARELLDDIINNGGFQLAPDYNDNYHTDTENNVESIFEIQVSTTSGDLGALNANMLGIVRPALWRAPPGPAGWGFFQPSQDLFEAFQTTPEGLPILDKADRDPLENDMGIVSSEEFIPTDHPLDPRVDWTIARRGISANGWGIFVGSGQVREQANGGPYHTKKYTHHAGELETADGRNTRNFRAYRYSHVLLWRAEIAVEENDLEYARELVNMIRNRAKNSAYVKGRVTTYVLDDQPTEAEINMDENAANYVISEYPAGAVAFQSQESARKAVRLEHRLEFATEGHRFFQLRRWGIDGEVLNDYIEADSRFRNFLQGVVYEPDRDEYFPLPQDQLDLQPVLSQDPAF